MNTGLDLEITAIALTAMVEEFANRWLALGRTVGTSEIDQLTALCAARAASASTPRQYGAIFRSFSDWLAAQLGRPPIVGDLDADVIAAYGQAPRRRRGGRDGRPAAPATVRVYLSMIRALAHDLGRGDETAGVRIPRHEPGPPETLTDTDYENLLRVPDRRTLGGKRDHALLRVLGDYGLRSAELRGLRARDLRRPRTNARHYRLFVRGKGGREREVPVPEATQQALEVWTAVHPLAGAVALLDEHALFVRLGRHGHEDPLPLSAVAVHRLVRRRCLAAGVLDRLAHPHALRAYWATRCLEAGVPVHEVSARLGHVDLRTTARYAAPRPERVDDVADVLDRRHQAARRAGWGRKGERASVDRDACQTVDRLALDVVHSCVVGVKRERRTQE